jgi:integrase
MARPPTGSVVEDQRGDTVRYGIRFRAYGKRHYVALGQVTRQAADMELENVLADVRRGIWKPATPAPVVEAAPTREPTFHEFSSEWFAAREAEGLAPKTLVGLRGSLTNHLLPHFARMRLGEITAQEIDRYKIAKAEERTRIEAAKQAAKANGKTFTERGLSNSSINGTLRHLAQVLDAAVDYGLIPSNPAMGKRRRLKTSRPARPWIEPHQLKPFLEAPSGVGRVLLWILIGTGVRNEEALSLRSQDIDLGTGHLYVRKSKTPKGVRRISLAPALREELTLWRNSARFTAPTDYVIHTSTGHAHNPSNLRRDVLAPAVKTADAALAELGILPIGHITFHGCRRSFASLRSYGGKSHRQTADLLGHEDVRFTLNVYAQSGLDPDEMLPPVRRAFDWALDWAAMGSNAPLTIPERTSVTA